MAKLQIDTAAVIYNIKSISSFLKKHNKQWSLITKVFSGDIDLLKRILKPDVIKDIHSIGDSRLSSLKILKEVNPALITIYIKPPALVYIDEVVKYADISLNTSYKTIIALNTAAKKQKKIHKIIIMVELGELREGIKRDELIGFYEKVFELEYIEVIGLGSNLGCMYGVEPTYDKLLQLCLYKELIQAKFNKDLPLISGGSSITLPLIDKNAVPIDMNHFRIGEAAFFGTSPLYNERFNDLNTEAFVFKTNIIELDEKKKMPDGVISDANIGHTADYDLEDFNATTTKAILDVGLLDVDKADIVFLDKEVSFVGITSDMMVVDIGTNKTKEGKKKYSIGSQVCFTPSYMGVARLLNSKFIDIEYL
ncbi:MAG: alanine racemase [Bacteroidales bacterium]|nr:alanine racemase [Bacteroidales bacterium]MDD4216213.1 alanine racemase [Bacteroidales bacterium]MDY0142538.1 alanine racemase [Bacteroidales bacterium]